MAIDPLNFNSNAPAVEPPPVEPGGADYTTRLKTPYLPVEDVESEDPNEIDKGIRTIYRGAAGRYNILKDIPEMEWKDPVTSALKIDMRRKYKADLLYDQQMSEADATLATKYDVESSVVKKWKNYSSTQIDYWDSLSSMDAKRLVELLVDIKGNYADLPGVQAFEEENGLHTEFLHQAIGDRKEFAERMITVYSSYKIQIEAKRNILYVAEGMPKDINKRSFRMYMNLYTGKEEVTTGLILTDENGNTTWSPDNEEEDSKFSGNPDGYAMVAESKFEDLLEQENKYLDWIMFNSLEPTEYAAYAEDRVQVEHLKSFNGQVVFMDEKKFNYLISKGYLGNKPGTFDSEQGSGGSTIDPATGEVIAIGEPDFMPLASDLFLVNTTDTATAIVKITGYVDPNKVPYTIDMDGRLTPNKNISEVERDKLNEIINPHGIINGRVYGGDFDAPSEAAHSAYRRLSGPQSMTTEVVDPPMPVPSAGMAGAGSFGFSLPGISGRFDPGEVAYNAANNIERLNQFIYGNIGAWEAAVAKKVRDMKATGDPGWFRSAMLTFGGGLVNTVPSIMQFKLFVHEGIPSFIAHDAFRLIQSISEGELDNPFSVAGNGNIKYLDKYLDNQKLDQMGLLAFVVGMAEDIPHIFGYGADGKWSVANAEDRFVSDPITSIFAYGMIYKGAKGLFITKQKKDGGVEIQLDKDAMMKFVDKWIEEPINKTKSIEALNRFQALIDKMNTTEGALDPVGLLQDMMLEAKLQQETFTNPKIRATANDMTDFYYMITGIEHDVKAARIELDKAYVEKRVAIEAEANLSYADKIAKLKVITDEKLAESARINQEVIDKALRERENPPPLETPDPVKIPRGAEQRSKAIETRINNIKGRVHSQPPRPIKDTGVEAGNKYTQLTPADSGRTIRDLNASLRLLDRDQLDPAVYPDLIQNISAIVDDVVRYENGADMLHKSAAGLTLKQKTILLSMMQSKLEAMYANGNIPPGEVPIASRLLARMYDVVYDNYHPSLLEIADRYQYPKLMGTPAVTDMLARQNANGNLVYDAGEQATIGVNSVNPTPEGVALDMATQAKSNGEYGTSEEYKVDTAHELYRTFDVPEGEGYDIASYWETRAEAMGMTYAGFVEKYDLTFTKDSSVLDKSGLRLYEKTHMEGENKVTTIEWGDPAYKHNVSVALRGKPLKTLLKYSSYEDFVSQLNKEGYTKAEIQAYYPEGRYNIDRFRASTNPEAADRPIGDSTEVMKVVELPIEESEIRDGETNGAEIWRQPAHEGVDYPNYREVIFETAIPLIITHEAVGIKAPDINHFPSHPNAFAFARLSDMVIEDSKYLFIEELQSDGFQGNSRAKNMDHPYARTWQTQAMSYLSKYAKDNGYDGIVLADARSNVNKYGYELNGGGEFTSINMMAKNGMKRVTGAKPTELTVRPNGKDGGMYTDQVWYTKDFPNQLVQFEKTSRGTNIRGAYEVRQAQTIIHAFKGGDVKTVIHEGAHWIFDTFTPAELESFKAVFKVDTITIAAKERFAKAYTVWVELGQAPAPEMIPLFKRISEYIYKLYDGFRTKGKMKLTPEMHVFFGKLHLNINQVESPETFAKAELQYISDNSSAGIKGLKSFKPEEIRAIRSDLSKRYRELEQKFSSDTQYWETIQKDPAIAQLKDFLKQTNMFKSGAKLRSAVDKLPEGGLVDMGYTMRSQRNASLALLDIERAITNNTDPKIAGYSKAFYEFKDSIGTDGIGKRYYSLMDQAVKAKNPYLLRKTRQFGVRFLTDILKQPVTNDIGSISLKNIDKNLVTPVALMDMAGVLVSNYLLAPMYELSIGNATRKMNNIANGDTVLSRILQFMLPKSGWVNEDVQSIFQARTVESIKDMSGIASLIKQIQEYEQFYGQQELLWRVMNGEADVTTLEPAGQKLVATLRDPNLRGTPEYYHFMSMFTGLIDSDTFLINYGKYMPWLYYQYVKPPVGGALMTSLLKAVKGEDYRVADRYTGNFESYQQSGLRSELKRGLQRGTYPESWYKTNRINDTNMSLLLGGTELLHDIWTLAMTYQLSKTDLVMENRYPGVYKGMSIERLTAERDSLMESIGAVIFEDQVLTLIEAKTMRQALELKVKADPENVGLADSLKSLDSMIRERGDENSLAGMKYTGDRVGINMMSSTKAEITRLNGIIDATEKTLEGEWTELPNGKSVRVKNFVKVPDNAHYGNLRGMHIPRSTMREIDAMIAGPPGYLRTARNVMRPWKFMKTVMNPKTHFRNVVWNSVATYISHDISPWDFEYYGKSLADIQNRDPMYTEFVENMGDASGYNVELETDLFPMLRDARRTLNHHTYLNRDQGDISFVFNSLLIKGSEAGGEGLYKAADLYKMEETVFKYSIYRKLRGEGKSIQESIAEANRVLFNYGDISAFDEHMRNLPGGSPFFVFYKKLWPYLIHEAAYRPHKLAMLATLHTAFGLVFAMVEGEEEDKKAKLDVVQWEKPRTYKGKDIPFTGAVVLPYKLDEDNFGKDSWMTINLGRLFPFNSMYGSAVAKIVYDVGKYGPSDTTMGLISPLLPGSGPVENIFAALYSNKDIFGNPVHKGTWNSVMDYIVRQGMPGWYPGNTDYERLFGRTASDPTTGEKDPIGQRITEVLGVPLGSTSPTTHTSNRYMIQREMKDINKKIMSLTRANKTRPIKDYWEVVAELQRKYNELQKDLTETFGGSDGTSKDK